MCGSGLKGVWVGSGVWVARGGGGGGDVIGTPGACGKAAGYIWFNNGQLTHVGTSKTMWDALPVLQKGHG
jgi:hypothetical protein